MDATKGCMMGLMAASFWRKDFGDNNGVPDLMLVCLSLVAAIVGGPAALLVLASVVLVTALRERASSAVSKNFRLFLVMSLFWTFRTTTLAPWMALPAATLQLLRRPAWLKEALREWRVASGPLFVMASCSVFVGSEGMAVLRIIGFLSVVVASVFLRPDNTRFDSGLQQWIPSWPLSVSARAKYHGLLLVVGLILMTVLMSYEGRWCWVISSCGLLLMEMSRRLPAPRPQSLAWAGVVVCSVVGCQTVGCCV
jgi:hypothetical protein